MAHPSVLKIFQALSVLIYHVLVTDAQAGATVQDDWTFPYNIASGESPASITIGDTVRIQWTPYLWTWFSTYANESSVDNVDLWITGYDLHQYEHLVATAVNVESTFTISWRADLPSDEVNAAATWVFRFVEAGQTPSDTDQQISSPLVVVRDAAGDATANTSITASATSTSASSATTAETPTSEPPSATASGTSAAHGTAQSTSTSELHHGLSSGAIAGIVVGAVLGAIALVAVGWLLARRRSKKHKNMPPYLAVATKEGTDKQFVASGSPAPIPEYSQTGTNQPWQQSRQELENTQRFSRPAELH